MDHFRAKRSRHLKGKTFGAERRGTAVMECALTAPLLLLVVFGSIDVGQFINVAQAVSNASRVGARVASRNDSVSVENIKNEVKDYLLASGIPKNSVTVTVLNSSGTELSAKALSAIPSGSAVSVKVNVNFSRIRRASFLMSLNDAENSSKSTMRRE